MKSHDQLALIGKNGIGKSSLIKAICGDFSGNISGQIDIANKLQINLVRQDYSSNHGLLREFAKNHQLDYEQLLNTLFKLGFKRQTFNIPIERMSMGQQKRVELAKSLVEPAQLYIWDEPLNYLDTYNQEQLIALIEEYQPPILFIEHDQNFIDEVASKQVQMVPIVDK